MHYKDSPRNFLRVLINIRLTPDICRRMFEIFNQMSIFLNIFGDLYEFINRRSPKTV